MTRKIVLLSLLACITPGILHAQETSARATAAVEEEGAAEELEGVTVVAGRLPGAVVGDIKPEETFTAADVRAFGVSSVSDILAEIAPQASSGRGGQPVVLLNGRRISSFGEIRDIPSEAIQRVEVLPEEVGLKYGYSADQKVVNIVLRPRFRAGTGEVGLTTPTAGGQLKAQLQASRLDLNRRGRTNLALKYSHSDALLESDRDLVTTNPGGAFGLNGNVAAASGGGQIDPALSALAGTPVTVAGVPASAASRAPTLGDFAANANKAGSGDVRDRRSLLPDSDVLSLNLVHNRTLSPSLSATLNASADYSKTLSLLGLASTRLTIPAGDPFSPFSQAVGLYRYRPDLGTLEQNTQSANGHLGFTLDSTTERWRVNLIGNYDHGVSWTRTDRGVDVTALQARLNALDPSFNPFAALPATALRSDSARSVSDSADLQLVVNGRLFKLPAGDLSGTMKVGAEGSWLDARSRRSGVETRANLSRTGTSAQASFDAPITSVKNDVLARLGDLSANLNLAVSELSDFGALSTVGYGLNWTPIRPVSLIVSMTHQENAPSVSQLGAPQVATPDARVFDYVLGRTVDVTRISGGNPDLKAETRSVLKLGLTVKPPEIEGLSVSANYFRTRVDDPIASFPNATLATEAAFSGRFTRDALGELTRVDARAVNFARQESDRVRWGFNYSRQIGKTPPRPDFNEFRRRRAEGGEAGGGWRQRREGQPDQGQPLQGQAGEGLAAQPGQAAGAPPPGMDLLRGALPQGRQRPPAAGGQDTPALPGAARSEGGFQRGFGGRGRGGGFGGPPGGGAARLQLAAYHTVRLREQVQIANGSRTLDLLSGDALGSSGGEPQNEVEVQAGFTKAGLGARLTANWQSATEVLGGTTPSGVLRFSSLTTVNLRLFANLAANRKLVDAYPFFRGSRVSLSVNNLFDARLQVRDANGSTPVSYQPDYLDPTGRTVMLSFRKVLF